MNTTRSIAPQRIKPLLAVGMLCVLIWLLLNISGAEAPIKPLLSFVDSSAKVVDPLTQACEGEIIEKARLSREQLLKILAIPERNSQSSIRQIVQEPYCRLSNLEVRAGVEAEREAYPLEFDPSTVLIILYENNEYAGYRFKHQ